jgi:hypothetical protein
MTKKSDHTRWLSLGTAVTFAVAAVAGVVGGKVTGHLTPALIVFAVLVAAGMAVSYWVDRRSRASSLDDDSSTAGLVDARGAQKVQNIIAMAPGSVAQGTFEGGQIIPHADVVESEGQPAAHQPPEPDDGPEHKKGSQEKSYPT